MLDQTFSPQSLNKLVSGSDVAKYSLGVNGDLVINTITSISYEVSQESFKFENVKVRKIKDKDVYYVDDRSEYFAVKKLNSIIKKLYTINHSNRNEILKQLI
ncbi:hypothetical protein EAY16_21895, partial [Vibrio anguillarum]